jgi:hypothetical protein
MPEIEHDWRLFQMFLQTDGRGVYHVYVDWIDNPERDFYCTCPRYTGHKSCRHIDHVLSKNVTDKGAITLFIRQGGASEEEVYAAVEGGADTHRALVLKHGVIEVL